VAATSSARIAACHALGLISEAEFKEAESVRKIRNEIAHKVQMSFENDRVRSLCAALKMSAQPYEKVEVTRAQFSTAAVALLLRLTNRAHYVRERALTYGEWKI
jgi:mannitol operon repressor